LKLAAMSSNSAGGEAHADKSQRKRNDKILNLCIHGLPFYFKVSLKNWVSLPIA
jgi:hypothetical protein